MRQSQFSLSLWEDDSRKNGQTVQIKRKKAADTRQINEKKPFCNFIYRKINAYRNNGAGLQILLINNYRKSRRISLKKKKKNRDLTVAKINLNK